MTSIEDIDREIKDNVNYVIDEGPIKGTPSTIIHFKEDVEVIER